MKRLVTRDVYPEHLRVVGVACALALVLSAGGFIRGLMARSSGSQGRDEVRIQLNSDGFAPAEVQHAPGAVAISVENTTLSGDYTLRLKAEDGTVLTEVQVQKGSSAWTVNLQTGRYTLTEVNHSQWICTLVVQ